MMFIIRNFTRSLFFGLFTLSFCHASVNAKRNYSLKTSTDHKDSVVVKSSATASKEEKILPEIDLSKLWIDASKKINKALPLITIEGENLSKLCQKVTQLADKAFPDCASLVSLSVTGFMGGLSCPGVDEKAPCYAVMFLNEGKFETVFLFKSQTDCLLVKNLTANKSSEDALKTIPNGDNKVCWQMYGNATLLKALDKDLRQVFPFIYQEKNPEMCLKFCLDFNLWNDIFQKVDDKSEQWSFIKYYWDTFVIPDIKKVEVGFDFTDKSLETKLSIHPQEYSPLLAFVKTLDAKSKTVKFITWSSREMIQELDFRTYSGLKNYVEAVNMRINYSKPINTFVEQFKNWWSIICPLVKDVLDFCDKNLTGNTQGYADLQNSNDLVSSKGFGFFEGTSHLDRDTVLRFVEEMNTKGKASLKEATDKKYFGSEFCKDISLNVKKSVEKHCNHDIDQIFWKGNGAEAYYPIWFAIHKNYLLYADEINNLKRLIERMEEMKTPSYTSLESNAFSHMKIDLGAIIRLLGSDLIKPFPELSVEITSGLKEGTIWTNTVKIFGFWDAFSLKTLLQSSNESGNKEGSVQSNEVMNAPVAK
ncbi:MAG: hypothetical protein ACSW8C_03945 [bacterium]